MNPNSLAALISGRSIRDAVRAVLSDSERVRRTLEPAESLVAQVEVNRIWRPCAPIELEAA